MPNPKCKGLSGTLKSITNIDFVVLSLACKFS